MSALLRAMDPTARLEEGPDHSTAMNFGGGGAASALRLRLPSRLPGRRLWQC